MNVGSGYAPSTNGSSASEPDAATAVPAPAALERVRGRPEVLVGAAFAGGVLAALLLRRLGR